MPLLFVATFTTVISLGFAAESVCAGNQRECIKHESTSGVAVVQRHTTLEKTKAHANGTTYVQRSSSEKAKIQAKEIDAGISGEDSQSSRTHKIETRFIKTAIRVVNPTAPRRRRVETFFSQAAEESAHYGKEVGNTGELLVTEVDEKVIKPSGREISRGIDNGIKTVEQGGAVVKAGAEAGLNSIMKIAAEMGKWASKAGRTAKQWVELVLSEATKAIKIEHTTTLCSNQFSLPSDLESAITSSCISDAISKVDDMIVMVQEFPTALKHAVESTLSDEKMYQACFGLIGKQVVNNIEDIFANPSWTSVTSMFKDVGETAKKIVRIIAMFFKRYATPVADTFEDVFRALIKEISGWTEHLNSIANVVKNTALLQTNASSGYAGGGEVAQFNGQTWYISGCVGGAASIFGLGFCVYFPFDKTGFRADGISFEGSLGIQLADLEVEGGVKFGPILTNQVASLDGDSNSLGMDFDLNCKKVDCMVDVGATFPDGPGGALTVDILIGAGKSIHKAKGKADPSPFAGFNFAKNRGAKAPGQPANDPVKKWENDLGVVEASGWLSADGCCSNDNVRQCKYMSYSTLDQCTNLGKKHSATAVQHQWGRYCTLLFPPWKSTCPSGDGYYQTWGGTGSYLPNVGVRLCSSTKCSWVPANDWVTSNGCCANDNVRQCKYMSYSTIESCAELGRKHSATAVQHQWGKYCTLLFPPSMNACPSSDGYYQTWGGKGSNLPNTGIREGCSSTQCAWIPVTDWIWANGCCANADVRQCKYMSYRTIDECVKLGTKHSATAVQHQWGKYCTLLFPPSKSTCPSSDGYYQTWVSSASKLPNMGIRSCSSTKCAWIPQLL